MSPGCVVRFKAGVALSSWPLWFIWEKDCPQKVTLLFDCPGACARRQLQRPSGTGHGPGAPGLCKGSEWFAWCGGQSLADVPP